MVVKISGHQKRTYLERYIQYNKGYQRFLKKYNDAVPGSDYFEEFQRRKLAKDSLRQRLYEETVKLLNQVTDSRALSMAELTFLEGFSIDEVASVFQLSEKRCTAILGMIYKDIQINI